MDLPIFRYHADPEHSGSVERSETSCRCCGRARGFIYTGPVYAETDLNDALCPWCIADGSAYRKFGATFVDVGAFADDVSPEAIEEITRRTPGFSAWQDERWLSRDGQPACFVEPAGIAEIRAHYRGLERELMSHIVRELGLSGSAAVMFLESLRRNHSPTAFIFRDPRDDAYLVYVDYL